LELTLRYWKNSNASSFGNNSHSTLTLCAKTVAEDGALFVTANYWGFLPDNRLNDWTEQQNGKRWNICIETW